MGFSDSFNDAIGALTGGLASSGFSKRAKSGKMTGGDWTSSLIAGPLGNLSMLGNSVMGGMLPIFPAQSILTKDSTGSLAALMADPSKDTFKAYGDSLVDGAEGLLYGANLGHQLARSLEPDEAPDVPISQYPTQNTKTMKAKQQARDRAVQDAARRRGAGLSGTIATTPLGLQGDGASTSSRRLIGE